MTEYTITYIAEITKVVTTNKKPEDVDKNAIANWIGRELNVDDVHVKNVKVFPREVEA